MKIAVVTDSTAYIPKEIREQWNIRMIPLNIIFGDKSYQEEIELSAAQFYEEVKHKELPTTSLHVENKVIVPFEKIRTRKKAIK